MQYRLFTRGIRSRQNRCSSAFGKNIFTLPEACPIYSIFGGKWNCQCHASICKFSNLQDFNCIQFFSDANLIFRGNSLVSKCIDTLMKLVGIRYLHQTLKGCVETVILEQKSCEIDPNRIKENESLESNMDNLKKYISNVFHSITLSMTKCPQIMREVFSVLKELTKVRMKR